VHTKDTRAKTKRTAADEPDVTAAQVIFAASALGTQKLLHTMKFTGDLPNLSGQPGSAHPDQLRVDPRGRSRRPMTRSWTSPEGVAITSSFHPDEHTHIEPVRYGKGSNVMSLLQTCAHRRPVATTSRGGGSG
jgi:cholesterol oxidase